VALVMQKNNNTIDEKTTLLAHWPGGIINCKELQSVSLDMPLDRA